MQITKIPVFKLLTILENLYDKGVNYIDFNTVQTSETECEVFVGYSKEYIDADFLDQYDFPDNTPDINKPISDEDINLLI